MMSLILYVVGLDVLAEDLGVALAHGGYSSGAAVPLLLIVGSRRRPAGRSLSRYEGVDPLRKVNDPDLTKPYTTTRRATGSAWTTRTSGTANAAWATSP
jgi:hypothetical protein